MVLATKSDCNLNATADADFSQMQCCSSLFDCDAVWNGDAYDDHLNWVWKRQWMLERWIREYSIQFDENWKGGSWA